MNLEGTCNTCDRRFLLTQLLPEPDGTGGRCPFCGTPFARHYLNVLPEMIYEAQEAFERFGAAMERLGDIKGGFEVDLDAAVRGLQNRLGDRQHAAG